MQNSTKRIKPLHEIVIDRMFILSSRHANDIDIKTGKPCIFIGVNGKYYYILVNEPTPIPYNVFCVLKDIGMLNSYKTYDEGKQI